MLPPSSANAHKSRMGCDSGWLAGGHMRVRGQVGSRSGHVGGSREGIEPLRARPPHNSNKIDNI